MKNVTITLPEAVAKQARIWAAEHDTSVSQMVGQLLTEKMRSLAEYESAGKSFLSRPARQLQERHAPYPHRDSLHERLDLR